MIYNIIYVNVNLLKVFIDVIEYQFLLKKSNIVCICVFRFYSLKYYWYIEILRILYFDIFVGVRQNEIWFNYVVYLC